MKFAIASIACCLILVVDLLIMAQAQMGISGSNTATAFLWVTLLTLIVTNVTALVKQWLDSRERRDEAERVRLNAEAAAKAVQQVKVALRNTNESIGGQLEQIHTLVNTPMGVALRTGAVALRRIATMSGEAGDAAAADAAEASYADHIRRQNVVDRTVEVKLAREEKKMEEKKMEEKKEGGG